jgi:fructose-1,6-bisphosphatase/inositol monophosphatase family enzyme
MDALSTAVAAIMREASATAILPRYRQLSADQIVEKAADDMVTVADGEAEAILAERLAALMPEAAVVGEEAVHADPSILHRIDTGLAWIIDPLDGTNNFAFGKPPFGVLVALSDGGRTVGGWILDCLTGRFCHALEGKGAWIDGEPHRARASGQTPPIAAISVIFADPERRAAITSHIAPHYTMVDIPRCAAEQYPRLALGTNDVSVFERTLPWDHAAGILFLNEAGGRAARPDGSAYRADQHGQRGLIGAASPALWDDLAERMAGL